MRLILLFILLSLKSFSQAIGLETTDEFTKEKIIQVNATKGTKWRGSDNIATGTFMYHFLSLRKVDTIKMLQLDMTWGFNICVSNHNDKIIILFADDSTLELKQVSKIDCADRVAARYFLTDDDIRKLSNTIIKKMRIYTTDGHAEFSIKEDRKELIKNTFILFQSKI